MNIQEAIARITSENGYAFRPSCVCKPNDKRAKSQRSVTILDNDTVEINASGRCLRELKRAIKEQAPGVRFADEAKPEGKKSKTKSEESDQ